MDRTPLSAPSAPPAGPYSAGLVMDGWVLLAGQPGTGSSVEEQTHNAMNKVSALLEAAGCGLEDVVSCLVHLADMSLFDRYNKVYREYFPQPQPVRTTVGAPLVAGALVEITAVARKPATSTAH